MECGGCSKDKLTIRAIFGNLKDKLPKSTI